MIGDLVTLSLYDHATTYPGQSAADRIGYMISIHIDIAGDDLMFGGAGADTMIGGFGADLMKGGSGMTSLLVIPLSITVYSVWMISRASMAT